MKSDLEQAVELLKETNITCVLCKDGQIYTSTERGVKPLIAFVESGRDYRGFSAADKIVGKAAAMLYVLLGVHTVFAEVMSEGGIYTLARHGIASFCDTSVKEIQNRSNTGICPMEEAVAKIDAPDEGMKAIQKKLSAMQEIHKEIHKMKGKIS